MQSPVASGEPVIAGASRGLRTAQTAGYYGAFIALGLVAAILGPTLPALAGSTGASLQLLGGLFAIRSFGYLLGSLQSGFLYDRFSGHPLMAAALIGFALALALVPLTSLFWVVAALYLALGVSEGLVDVGGNALLVAVHREKLGAVMNGLHFCFGVGAFLAPIVVAQLVLLGRASLDSYWVLAALMLPVALFLLRLPSPDRLHHGADGQPEPLNVRLIVPIALFLVLYVGAEVSFGGWVYSYAETLGLMDAASGAYLTSAFWGSLTAGRLLAIPIAARLRPRAILLADLVGCLASVGAIVAWPASTAVLWIGAIGLGLSMASIFPTMLAFAARRMAMTGKVTSWFLVGASVGAMVVPWMIGQLSGALGPQITMVVILADLALAAVVFALLMRYAGQPTRA